MTLNTISIVIFNCPSSLPSIYFLISISFIVVSIKFHQTTILWKLPKLLHITFASFSPWQSPGHVPDKRCSLRVPICMLPCCRCHFLALYPCVRERGRGGEPERGRWGGGMEGNVRAKEERQGNKAMHADAGSISFTNMQILLPLWYANERLQSAN